MVSSESAFGVTYLSLDFGVEYMPSLEVFGWGATVLFDCGPEDGAELIPDNREEFLLDNRAELLMDNRLTLSSECEVGLPSKDGADLLSESGEDRFSEPGAGVTCENGVESDRPSENGVEMPSEDGAELPVDNVGPGSGFFKWILRPEEALRDEDSRVWASLSVAVSRRRDFFFGRVESSGVEVKRMLAAGLGERLPFLVEDLLEPEKSSLPSTSPRGP